MLHNGEVVLRRGQHRVWRISADGKRILWKPTSRDSEREIRTSGAEMTLPMVLAALRGEM